MPCHPGGKGYEQRKGHHGIDSAESQHDLKRYSVQTNGVPLTRNSLPIDALVMHMLSTRFYYDVLSSMLVYDRVCKLSVWWHVAMSRFLAHELKV